MKELIIVSDGKSELLFYLFLAIGIIGVIGFFVVALSVCVASG